MSTDTAAQTVKWDDSNMSTSYADVCNVSYTREEIVLLFGMSQAMYSGQRVRTARLTGQMILNPFVAKKLSNHLRKVILEYDSKYGSPDVEFTTSTGTDLRASSSLPSPQIPQTEKAAEKSGLIFKLINNLNIKHGFERSFKMSEKTLLGNRFLLGIGKEEIQQERLLDICQRMDMPDKYQEIFKQNLPDANMVLFGFEEGKRGCVYKVYLEFWEKTKRNIRDNPDNREPATLHLGLKWDTTDNTISAVSRYTCFPMLSVKDILKRVSSIYRGYKEQTSYEIARDMINLASSRIHNAMFLYVEVSEVKNTRRSFDINLYKAELQLKDIQSFLEKMCRFYSISSERFNVLYGQNKDKVFGHLAGGIDREGRDFLTIYYEVERG